jgi:hypothetical protein
VLMFNDSTWAPNVAAKERWEQWKWAVLSLASHRSSSTSSNPTSDGETTANTTHATAAAAAAATPSPLSVAVLEIGCGNNVTTIRQRTEAFVADANERGAIATLIRVNPEFPLADTDGARPRTLPLLSKGLAAVELIDRALHKELAARSSVAERMQTKNRSRVDPMAGLRFQHLSMEEEGASQQDQPQEETTRSGEAPAVVAGAPRLHSMSTPAAPESSRLRQEVSTLRGEAEDMTSRVDRAQDTVDKTLADIREMQKKFERFDELGRQLQKGLAKLL